MPDLEQARLMLQLAEGDLQAAAAMTDETAFQTRVFGFHAQQAVEKALKAWLSLADAQYPRIHDLEALFGLLSDRDWLIPDRFQQLAFLTEFAVQFRYSAFNDLTDSIDRPAVIREVGELLQHVEDLLRDAEAGA